MRKKVIGKIAETKIFTYNPKKEHAKLLNTNKVVKESYEEANMKKLNKVMKQKNIQATAGPSKEIDKMFAKIGRTKEGKEEHMFGFLMYDIIIFLQKEMKRQHMSNLRLAKKAGLKKEIVDAILNDRADRVEFKALIKIAVALKKKIIVKFVQGAV